MERLAACECEHGRKARGSGFRNVSSFPMIPALDSGKVKLLVESGQMHRCAMRRFGANGMKAAGGAIAKAMSNHRLFEELAADSEGPEFVGIFEDDLLLTSEAHEVKQRIRDALKQLPPSADVLWVLAENKGWGGKERSKGNHMRVHGGREMEWVLYYFWVGTQVTMRWMTKIQRAKTVPAPVADTI